MSAVLSAVSTTSMGRTEAECSSTLPVEQGPPQLGRVPTEHVDSILKFAVGVKASMWIVLRDDRGAVSWVELRLEIE